MSDPLQELDEIIDRYLDRPMTRELAANYIRELIEWAKDNEIDF
jgi:hypothetical protein